MSSVHTVLFLDEDGRLVASRYSVPTAEVGPLVEQFRAQHPQARVLVDGRDLTGPVTGGPQKASVGVEVIAAVSGEEQRSTAELAHFMLWESFKRSCQVQNYMLTRMTSSAVEMNQRFVQELETMRGSYTKALERIDGMEFEKRMLEHEAASRRLTAHYQRLVEADHRAAERRRDDDRSALEQFARGVMRVVDAIGDPNNGNDKN